MLVPENQSPTVAVLLPCYNEEVTIGKVVRDFKASLPQADIYVYDNNSTEIPLIAPPISLRQRAQSSARSHAKAKAT